MIVYAAVWIFFFMHKSEGKAESTGDPVSLVEWLEDLNSKGTVSKHII